MRGVETEFLPVLQAKFPNLQFWWKTKSNAETDFSVLFLAGAAVLSKSTFSFWPCALSLDAKNLLVLPWPLRNPRKKPQILDMNGLHDFFPPKYHSKICMLDVASPPVPFQRKPNHAYMKSWMQTGTLS